MKKILFLLSFFLTTQLVQAQQTTGTLLSAVTATASVTGVITTQPRVQSMTICTSTSSTYVGTTATVTLKASDDGISWNTVYADDNTTPLSWTIGTASARYDFLIKTAAYHFYLVIYTVGDASAGTITTTYNQQ